MSLQAASPARQGAKSLVTTVMQSSLTRPPPSPLESMLV